MLSVTRRSMDIWPWLLKSLLSYFCTADIALWVSPPFFIWSGNYLGNIWINLSSVCVVFCICWENQSHEPYKISVAAKIHKGSSRRLCFPETFGLDTAGYFPLKEGRQYFINAVFSCGRPAPSARCSWGSPVSLLASFWVVWKEERQESPTVLMEMVSFWWGFSVESKPKLLAGILDNNKLDIYN